MHARQITMHGCMLVKSHGKDATAEHALPVLPPAHIHDGTQLALQRVQTIHQQVEQKTLPGQINHCRNTPTIARTEQLLSACHALECTVDQANSSRLA